MICASTLRTVGVANFDNRLPKMAKLSSIEQCAGIAFETKNIEIVEAVFGRYLALAKRWGNPLEGEYWEMS